MCWPRLLLPEWLVRIDPRRGRPVRSCEAGQPATNIATVTPLAPGQFRISLNTTVAAVYQVRVTVNDEVVPAAAAAVEYRPGAAPSPLGKALSGSPRG